MEIERRQLIVNVACRALLQEAEWRRQVWHGQRPFGQSRNHKSNDKPPNQVKLENNVLDVSSWDETNTQHYDAPRSIKYHKRVDYFSFFFLGGGQNPKAKERSNTRTGGAVTSVHRSVSCSWWHEEGDERSTCGKSASRSCILKPGPSVKVQ